MLHLAFFPLTARGGVQGKAKNLKNDNSPSTWPKSGRGSRGGRG